MLESNPSADAGNGVVSGRSRFHQPCPDAFSSTLFGKAIHSAVNNGKRLGVIENALVAYCPFQKLGNLLLLAAVSRL
jgi:hypothetical protein